MLSLELVLAPGVTDSALSLSYPYANELVNSAIKALVYIRVGVEDMDSFSALGAFAVLDVNIDFRKCLHIITNFSSAPDSLPRLGWAWGCRSHLKHYVGTSIIWISLADFDVDKFDTVSASPCKFPLLIANFIDDQEAQGSWHYPTNPFHPHFPTDIEASSCQSQETARVSTLSHGTRREIDLLVLGNRLQVGTFSMF